jgi:hypothetical protein
MRSMYLELLYLLCFSRRSREKKNQLKGRSPFDPVFVGSWGAQCLRSFGSDFVGSLRASTVGAQSSIFEFPLLGGGMGWDHV